jgi:hypothetical protein
MRKKPEKGDEVTAVTLRHTRQHVKQKIGKRKLKNLDS